MGEKKRIKKRSEILLEEQHLPLISLDVRFERQPIVIVFIAVLMIGSVCCHLLVCVGLPVHPGLGCI